jgi:hypothetical protein
MPATLQVQDDFKITGSTSVSGLDVLINCVDPLAELQSEIMTHHKVIQKIIQNPVSQGGECPNPNDSGIILQSIDGPLQPGHQKGEQITRRQVRAKCQKKVGDEFVVHKRLGGNLGHNPGWGGCTDILRPGEIADHRRGIHIEHQRIKDGWLDRFLQLVKGRFLR